MKQIGFEGAPLDMMAIRRFKASPKILEALSGFMGKVGREISNGLFNHLSRYFIQLNIF